MPRALRKTVQNPRTPKRTTRDRYLSRVTRITNHDSRHMSGALHQRLHRRRDPLRVEPLVSHLLPQPAGTFFVRADVVVLALEAALQQLSAEAAAQAGLDVIALGHKHERRGHQL